MQSYNVELIHAATGSRYTFEEVIEDSTIVGGELDPTSNRFVLSTPRTTNRHYLLLADRSRIEFVYDEFIVRFGTERQRAIDSKNAAASQSPS